MTQRDRNALGPVSERRFGRDDWKARAQASETLVRELVEGLRPFGAWAEQAITSPSVLDSSVCLLDSRAPVTVGHFRKAQALILRAEGEGSSVAESAAPVASQPGCSAAQNLDGKGEL